MVEIFNKKSFEKIEFYGEGFVKKEKSRREKIKQAFDKISEAKSFRQIMLSRIKYFSLSKDKETELILRSVLEDYKRFEKTNKFKLEKWRGKSGIKLIEEPDRFICITYKKDEKDSEPKEIKKEIMKEQLNDLIVVLNTFKDTKKIPTSEIAEKLYNKSWKHDIYGDREKHISLTYMLNILEQRELIKYSRKGFTTIIKKLDYFLIK